MKISKEKKDKIAEQILFFLFNNHLKPFFTSEISQELARDEEFTKKLLLDLSRKKVIIKISKNSSGLSYSRRLRWRLSDAAFKAYKEKTTS